MARYSIIYQNSKKENLEYITDAETELGAIAAFRYDMYNTPEHDTPILDIWEMKPKKKKKY